MLVLTRKKSERIWIGESVLLTVVELGNGQVRLAFEAPTGVSIDREEVRKRRRLREQGAERGMADEEISARGADLDGRADACGNCVAQRLPDGFATAGGQSQD